MTARTTRQRLGRDEVVRAAEDLLDRIGWDHLTMAGLASELGVKAPSLYHHLEGLDALKAELHDRIVGKLAAEVGRSMDGREGAAALEAMCAAHRRVARRFPRRYEAVGRIQTNRIDQPELGYQLARSVLLDMGVPDEQIVEIVTVIFVTLHGLISLENVGFFGPDVDSESIFRRLVGVVVSVAESAAADGTASTMATGS